MALRLVEGRKLFPAVSRGAAPAGRRTCTKSAFIAARRKRGEFDNDNWYPDRVDPGLSFHETGARSS